MAGFRFRQVGDSYYTVTDASTGKQFTVYGDDHGWWHGRELNRRHTYCVPAQTSRHGACLAMRQHFEDKGDR